MKRALILFWHGLGDIIMLTPHLRHLYNEGYKTDLMCLPETRTSRILEHCPYVGKLIDVENPWRKDDRQLEGLRSRKEFDEKATCNLEKFETLRKDYDWSGASPHYMGRYNLRHKIDTTSVELGVRLKSKRMEVFIPESAESEARKYMDGDYIFVHTKPRFHAYHNWDATEWMKENLPPLRIINTGYEEEHFMAFDNINTAFVIAREAKHRVLSSSVFLPACVSMGCVIDVINYGRPDHKVWPVDQSKILHIREKGKWIK